MSDYINFNDFKREAERELKNRVRTETDNRNGILGKAAGFIRDHEDDLRTIAPYVAVGVPAVSAIVAKLSKSRKRHDDLERRECWFYDARRHRWSQSRRPLTPHERMEMDYRYDMGESYDQILNSLRLLK